jgi:hypothetical protein
MKKYVETNDTCQISHVQRYLNFLIYINTQITDYIVCT